MNPRIQDVRRLLEKDSIAFVHRLGRWIPASRLDRAAIREVGVDYRPHTREEDVIGQFAKRAYIRFVGRADR